MLNSLYVLYVFGRLYIFRLQTELEEYEYEDAMGSSGIAANQGGEEEADGGGGTSGSYW